MKNFRLVVALRLAIFPLIFNLSIAQELEIVPEDYVISTLNEVNEEKSTEQIDGGIPMESHASFYSAQNDRENTQDSSVNASE